MLQATIREGQQRSVQGALGVLQYGIVLVDVLHYFRVELILLEKKKLSYFHNKLKHCSKNFSSPPESQLECQQLRVCLSGVIRVELAGVRIHLW